MIKYFLVVILQIAGEHPITLEDIEQPDLLSCINEMVNRLQDNEKGLIKDVYNNGRQEQYEYSVACHALKPEVAPL